MDQGTDGGKGVTEEELRGTLSLVLEHLALLVRPVTDAANADATEFAVYLISTGIVTIEAEDATAAAKTFNGVSLAVRGVSGFVDAAQDAAAGDQVDVFALIKAGVDLLQALIQLNSATFDVFAFRPELLFDVLFLTYIETVFPRVYAILLLIGVVSEGSEFNPVVPTPAEVELDGYGRILAGTRRMRWETLSELFTQGPRPVMRDVYGWGEMDGFRGPLLVERLHRLFVACDLDAYPSSLPFGPPDEVVSYPAVRIQLHASSFAEGGIVIAATEQDVVVGPYGSLQFAVSEVFDDRFRVTVEVSLQDEGVLLVKVSPPARFGIGFNAAALTVSFKLTLEAANSITDPSKPWILFGQPGKTMLTLGGVSTSLCIGYQDQQVYLDVTAGVAELRLRIEPPSEDDDAFMSKILPRDPIDAVMSIILGYHTIRGFYLGEGSSLDLDVWTKIPLGPITIDGIHMRGELGLDDAGAFGMQIIPALSLTAKMGPVFACVQKMGMRILTAFPGAGGSAASMPGLKFKPPNMVAMSINTTAVTGGGFIQIDAENHRYAGGLQLALAKQFSVSALCLVSLRFADGRPGFSMLVSISATFGSAGIQLGYGFSLNGIGGLFGIHRTLDSEAFLDAVMTGLVSDLMFPDNLVERADEVLANVRAVFPVAEGRFVFGPFLRIAWGAGLVLVDIGVLLEVPSPVKIVLLGSIKIDLPVPNSPVLHLQIDVLGIVDFGLKLFALSGTLRDSHILEVIKLTGDFAMRLTWGDQPSFMMSVGGYHPLFQPPIGFPSLKRLDVSMELGGIVMLRFEKYFAITSNTVQFGSRMDVEVSMAVIYIHGYFGFDALFIFRPFSMRLDFVAGFEVCIFGASLGLDMAGTLTGPTPWSISGSVSGEVLCFSFSESFEVEWGEERKEIPPAIALLDVVLPEFEAPDSWTTTNLVESAMDITLVDRAADDEQGGDTSGDANPATRPLLMHPMGSIAFKQRIVPFAVHLARYGNALPSDVCEFDVRVRQPDGEIDSDHGQGIVLGARANETVQDTEPLYDVFGMGRFHNLSEEEKLTRPSFEKQVAGFRVVPQPVEITSATPVYQTSMAYEVIMVEPPSMQPPPSAKTPAEAQELAAEAEARKQARRMPVNAECAGIAAVRAAAMIEARETKLRQTLSRTQRRKAGSRNTAKALPTLKPAQTYAVVKRGCCNVEETIDAVGAAELTRILLPERCGTAFRFELRANMAGLRRSVAAANAALLVNAGAGGFSLVASTSSAADGTRFSVVAGANATVDELITRLGVGHVRAALETPDVQRTQLRTQLSHLPWPEAESALRRLLPLFDSVNSHLHLVSSAPTEARALRFCVAAGVHATVDDLITRIGVDKVATALQLPDQSRDQLRDRLSDLMPADAEAALRKLVGRDGSSDMVHLVGRVVGTAGTLRFNVVAGDKASADDVITCFGINRINDVRSALATPATPRAQLRTWLTGLHRADAEAARRRLQIYVKEAGVAMPPLRVVREVVRFDGRVGAVSLEQRRTWSLVLAGKSSVQELYHAVTSEPLALKNLVVTMASGGKRVIALASADELMRLPRLEAVMLRDAVQVRVAPALHVSMIRHVETDEHRDTDPELTAEHEMKLYQQRKEEKRRRQRRMPFLTARKPKVPSLSQMVWLAEARHMLSSRRLHNQVYRLEAGADAIATWCGGRRKQAWYAFHHPISGETQVLPIDHSRYGLLHQRVWKFGGMRNSELGDGATLMTLFERDSPVGYTELASDVSRDSVGSGVFEINASVMFKPQIYVLVHVGGHSRLTVRRLNPDSRQQQPFTTVLNFSRFLPAGTEPTHLRSLPLPYVQWHRPLEPGAKGFAPGASYFRIVNGAYIVFYSASTGRLHVFLAAHERRQVHRSSAAQTMPMRLRTDSDRGVVVGAGFTEMCVCPPLESERQAWLRALQQHAERPRTVAAAATAAARAVASAAAEREEAAAARVKAAQDALQATGSRTSQARKAAAKTLQEAKQLLQHAVVEADSARVAAEDAARYAVHFTAKMYDEYNRAGPPIGQSADAATGAPALMMYRFDAATQQHTLVRLSIRPRLEYGHDSRYRSRATMVDVETTASWSWAFETPKRTIAKLRSTTMELQRIQPPPERVAAAVLPFANSRGLVTSRYLVLYYPNWCGVYEIYDLCRRQPDGYSVVMDRGVRRPEPTQGISYAQHALAMIQRLAGPQHQPHPLMRLHPSLQLSEAALKREPHLLHAKLVDLLHRLPHDVAVQRRDMLARVFRLHSFAIVREQDLHRVREPLPARTLMHVNVDRDSRFQRSLEWDRVEPLDRGSGGMALLVWRSVTGQVSPAPHMVVMPNLVD